MVRIKNSRCLGCRFRRVKCHETCNWYINWKLAHEDERKKNRKSYSADAEYVSYQLDSREDVRKGRRQK